MHVAIHQSLRVAVTRSRAKVLFRWRRIASRKAATGVPAAGLAGAFLAGFGAGLRALTTLTDFFAGFFFLGMIVGEDNRP